LSSLSSSWKRRILEQKTGIIVGIAQSSDPMKVRVQVKSQEVLAQQVVTLANLRCLKWAIGRHFRQKGLRVHLASIKLGNVAIDGEVEGKCWKMALEIKTPGDDITRGIGQLAEWGAHL